MTKAKNKPLEPLLDLAQHAPDVGETVALMMTTEFMSIRNAQKVHDFMKRSLVTIKMSCSDEALQTRKAKAIIDNYKDALKNLQKEINAYTRVAERENRKARRDAEKEAQKLAKQKLAKQKLAKQKLAKQKLAKQKLAKKKEKTPRPA